MEKIEEYGGKTYLMVDNYMLDKVLDNLVSYWKFRWY